MIELLRTNDPVLLSFAESLLRTENIPVQVLDAHASAVDGSLGLLPRRLMVLRSLAGEAREILRAAGLGQELSPQTGEGAGDKGSA